MSGIDWPTIRAKFEQGVSQRQLAREFGVAQPTISERAKRDGWKRLVTFPIIEPITASSMPIDDSEPENLLAIVQDLLKLVSQHAKTDLEPKDIKSLADALSQFNKIMLTAVINPETSPYDLRDLLSYCTPEQREIMKPIFAEAAAKKAEAQEKNKPARKTG